MKKITYLLCIALFINISCKKNEAPSKYKFKPLKLNKVDEVIIDCNYSFEEAIKGSPAPQNIIDQLVLINVQYFSMDAKKHQGQILTNKLIADEIKTIFEYILEQKFPVQQAIPIVKFDWNDELSMQNNNCYSFCYRNVQYSKHAIGMAIDINPFLNPMRWKPEFSYRKDLPEGASYNPEIPGAFSADNQIVIKFQELGFIWGHNFKRNFDDHHFEKR